MRRLPPNVERNKIGARVYYYFRVGKGPRIRLPDDPTSAEFELAYAMALSGKAEKRVQREVEGTISALIVSYYKSDKFKKLRPTSKAGYISRCEALRVAHGHRAVAGMTLQRIEEKILAPYDDRPGQQHAILKMLRVLIRHAIRIGWLNHDPSMGIERAKLNEIRSWKDAEIAAFEARWPIGTKERLAFALMLYTGQRRSDIHRMTWADVSLRKISVKQQKTGASLQIPIHRDLQTVLQAAPREHVTILNTAYGRPFTVDGFSSFLRDAITAAGLPLDAQPHGLRKAAGRRLAEANCTPHQIMAILGHKSLAEAERYTRDAAQVKLAEAAIFNLENGEGSQAPQTGKNNLGSDDENGRKTK